MIEGKLSDKDIILILSRENAELKEKFKKSDTMVVYDEIVDKVRYLQKENAGLKEKIEKLKERSKDMIEMGMYRSIENRNNALTSELLKTKEERDALEKNNIKLNNRIKGLTDKINNFTVRMRNIKLYLDNASLNAEDRYEAAMQKMEDKEEIT